MAEIVIRGTTCTSVVLLVGEDIVVYILIYKTAFKIVYSLNHE